MQTFDVIVPPKQEKRKLSANCPLSDIESEYGIGAFLYFDFLRFIIISNSVLFVICEWLCLSPLLSLTPSFQQCTVLINWIPHVIKHHAFLTDGLDIIFVSGYESYNRLNWRITTGIAFGLALFFGWIYPIRARQVLQTHDPKINATGEELWEMDSMNILPEQMGMIETNLRISDWSRGWRMVLSSILFILYTGICAVAIALPVVFQVKLVKLVNFDLDTRIWYTPLTVWDFLVAIWLNILDFTGKRVSGRLTRLERHKRRATHSKYKTAKLFIFKLVLVSSLYVAQRVASNILNESLECPFRPEAIRFLTILISDLTIGNFLVWLVPLLRKIQEKKDIKKGKTIKPIQFDIGNEHMELMYRQYVMYLGMSVFPFIVLFVIIIDLIEYPLDKARLVKLANGTKKITGSFAIFLAIFLSFMAILGFVVWPDGGLYSLAGPIIQKKYYCPCNVFSNSAICPTIILNTSSLSS